jgi:hypothetical protein
MKPSVKLTLYFVVNLTFGALVGGVAGCGGDQVTTTTTAESGATGATGAVGAAPELTAFLDDANAICRETGKEIDAAAEEEGITQNSPEAEIIDFAERVAIPAFQDRLDQIAELEPPPGDEDEVEEIVVTAQEVIDELEASPRLILEDPFAEVDELGNEYGLTACSG